MHDETSLTMGRARRVFFERILPECYGARVNFSIEAYELPGEPVPVSEGPGLDYQPFTAGTQWGPPWATTWFHVRATIPQDWAGQPVEALMDLGFEGNRPGFQCEALVMRPDLTPVKAVNPRNHWVPVTESAQGGEEIEFYLEAASNPVILGDQPFIPTQQGDRETADSNPIYTVHALELRVIRREVWELAQDVDLLMHQLPHLPQGQRKGLVLQALDDAMTALDLRDIPGTAAAARAVLHPVLDARGPDSAHRISAIGHSHIDSAWLWPLRETKRKAGRTVSSMTDLLERYPEFRYGMSSAQQYAWVKENYPAVWERLKAAVAEGRFEPLGGMWVESDTVMPSGESMVRQFLQGQLFFEKEFGKRSRGVWLPDSFGYSPALPQLIRRAGFEWFFTQKISWNQVNTFPHHSFDWEGIDGSRVFTHFPPMDTYNAELSGDELDKADRQFREHRKASGSIAPVGWGDGGGGTTREMIARAARLSNLDGSPHVQWESPDVFFDRAKAEMPHPPVWVGELYLELHRAVTTSQHKTKQGNRRSEHLLVEAEWWATAAWLRTGAEYPYDELQELWRIVLTHQFHDILPGTSIAWVHREAIGTYADVISRLERLIEASLAVLAGEGSLALSANPSSFEERGALPGGIAVAPQRTGETAPDDAADATVRESADAVVLSNAQAEFTFDRQGLLLHAVDLSTGRDYSVPGRPGNLFQLHEDFPNQWDAWDVDRFYRDSVQDLAEVAELRHEVSDGVATLFLTRTFGDSTLSQRLSLAPGERTLRVAQETEWKQTEQFLKLAFPLSVWAQDAVAETQFGFHRRVTHTNTSWENAKFETSTQRWVLIGDRDGGVALANESSHGFDVTRDVTDETGMITTLRLSVLRAPRYPDPDTDHGVHTHEYALQLGSTELAATRLGHSLNARQRSFTGARAVQPLVTVEGEGVLLDAVKPSEDRSGDLIVRVHEAGGHHAAAQVRLDVPFASAVEVSLLEDAAGPELPAPDGAVRLGLTPFSVRTLRFRLA
ncbi:alpha-mannosidase [Galactobacter caseinivorans]|uniref:Alpha-mannosidase n=1 Tax=Galactobacter caseinivorans TaxID=2676123 RepID=A0A496PH64_9MICC|nr:glycoside hydrolase family 38 C-terminal domain-containing protein [Galactobacter caseinivorans]RKW69827.1 alpha-mannosidase [Galactobacter caseinivorans]